MTRLLPSRRRRALSSAAAMTLATALVSTGLVLGVATPASAAPAGFTDDQREVVFTNPSGTDWTVPAGVDVVYVGLRGGDGGNAGRAGAGGPGANIVVRVDVAAGDILTLHAGLSGNGRTGGSGYRPGSNGGKGSLDGKDGGGGGGAAALLVNGALAAVAGGGGGAGGSGGKGIGHGEGGSGGSPVGPFEHGENGKGSNPGAGAGSFRVYGMLKHGTDAENGSAGGGGGGGGGGWPWNGVGGGGADRSWRAISNSGGGGGSFGASWVSSSLPGVTHVKDVGTAPASFADYRGPIAAKNTVRVVIPEATAVTMTAPETIGINGSPVIRFQPQVATGPRAGTLVSGTIRVAVDGVTVGTYSTADAFWTSGWGYAVYTLDPPMPTLARGTHTITAEFTAGNRGTSYAYPEERSTATATIRVMPRITGSVAITGDPYVGATLTADASGITSPAPLGTLAYQWYRDADPIPGATGAHYVVTTADQARDLRVAVSASEYAEWLQSPPVVVQVATTLTLATNATGPIPAAEDVTVTATLGSPALPPSGSSIELRVDGTAVASDTIRNGVSTFTLTGLGVGTHTLVARYAGDAVNQPVESAPVTVTVELQEQTIALGGLPIEIEVGETAQLWVSGGSGTGAVTYATSDASVATVSASGVLTAHAVGPVTVTATMAADGRYDAASSSASTTVVPDDGITPTPIDLSTATAELAGPGPFVYNGAPIRPGVASVTLPDSTVLHPGDYVVGYGTNTTVATGGSVTITGQGAYTGSLVVPFAIDPLAVTITADDEVKEVGAPDPSLDWDATPAILPGDALIGALTHAGIEVGTYPITQGTLDLSNPNYAFTFVPGTMAIVPTADVREVWARILALPDPIATRADADDVADVTNAYTRLTLAERGHLPSTVVTALETAQSQAGVVNRSEYNVEAVSAELTANWNLRLVVTPRTADGSPDVVRDILAKLKPDNRLPLALYDLEFIDTLTGDPWHPTNPVTVTFTSLSLAAWKEIGVIHELADGTLERIAATVDGGSVRFTATSFSLYGVTAAGPVTPAGDDADGTDDGTASDGALPVTGPSTDGALMAWVGGLLLLGGAALMLWRARLRR